MREEGQNMVYLLNDEIGAWSTWIGDLELGFVRDGFRAKECWRSGKGGS